MKKKILIVDDEPDVMTMLAYRLRDKGLEVVAVEDGQSGIDAAKEINPDLILLDYHLPGMDGREVASRINADRDRAAHIPIILITADAPHISRKARECGAIDFILKPIDPEILLKKVSLYAQNT